MSVLMLAFGYLRSEPHDASARLFFVIALGIVCYLINGMSMAHVESALRIDVSGLGAVLSLGTNAIPGLFMLYCHRVFQDGRRAPWPLVALLWLELLLDHLNFRSSRPSPFLSVQADSSLVQFLLGPIPDFIQISFAVLALYWTARGWSSDLVESRRLLRWLVVTVQGGLILLIVFLENYLLSAASASYGQVQKMIVYVISASSVLTLLMLMKFDYVAVGNVIRKVTPFVPTEHAEDAMQSEVKRFNKVFKEGRVYREHGLTIANLAMKVDLPEYRLRALINKHLGYRNFNALLHEYRIEDASQMLADRSHRHLPVLTIALTVGYQSITPFNNAFRQMKGVTPTEYRKRALQNSAPVTGSSAAQQSHR